MFIFSLSGIELSGSSEGPRMSFNPLNLRIEDDSSNYYKPGFPYNGRVSISLNFSITRFKFKFKLTYFSSIVKQVLTTWS